ncbi:TPA: hypothetical protein ACX1L3_000974 [Listeria monocytogenes]|uniref:hypothetical protein n=1 Tax=Listeria monocytogenes TaxID=1639 RepID=UPI000ECD5DE6|nr:hypothetical protein [Listeria monocytogenes]EAC3591519.1 hypothetical protein [Listeria monocytogenes]EAC5876867.1 hypothetical protein [Listeria monocytogenes]EAC6773277.1 hypothetical protein [Listeria monocytogenes]EAD4831854.1 hypothetical protein [Listeria monocytogenes]EAD8886191.1 hypothetical protein [Listeria monocytogenes]
MAIYKITADSEDQGWMDAFNFESNTDYKVGEVLSGDLTELRQKIYQFNNGVAWGPAISIVEVQDED